MLKHAAEGGVLGTEAEERKSGTMMAIIPENTAQNDGGNLDAAVEAE
jgi:hypothetical protein